MHATSTPTPPSTPEPGAAWSEFRHVRVTCVTEDSKTSPQADVDLSGPALDLDLYNQSWKLIRVPANQVETSCPNWFNSEPEINVAGKTEDGKAYEVVIHASYVQWLSFLGYDICFDYDPTAPIREDILVYGVWEATKRGHTRFLRNAVNRIRSGCSRGYEECCRNLARSNGLGIPLERALLTHDILESDPPVRKLFTQYLVFLGLNRQRSYDSYEALELLAKDQADLLQPFQKCHTDPFKKLSEHKAPIKTLHGSELQMISLVRDLLELSGGIVDCRQHALDQEYTISDNLNLFMILVGVTGTNRFGDFDPKEMYSALLKSKVFEDSDIGTLDTVGWSMRMLEFLPIGFPEGYLDLPSQVLSELSSGEVDLVSIYFGHTYHRCPSLRKPENNVLLLLTWSSITHGRPLRVLSEWASSGDALNLCQRLVKDFQNSQAPEQLALILAALLCHGRLLSYTSDDTVQPTNGCYLADLDVLLSGKSLSNQRTVFERTGFSFLRVLTTFGDEYEAIIQILAVVLDKDPPLLEPFDGLTDQYGVERIKNKTPHLSAYEGVKGLDLMKQILELSINVGSPSQSINNILEGYWMVEFPGKSSEDTRRISSADTANLDEEFSWLDEDLET